MHDACISLDGADWQLKGFIGEDWLWRRAHCLETNDRQGWIAALVPGSVHHDLWQAGVIPDPYYERNSLLMEWVPERTWVFRKRFFIGEEHRDERVLLRFEGVDYAAQFFLNDERLGSHASMSSPAVFEVGDRLKYGADNLLAVILDPAPQEEPQVGRTSRVRTNKSRMTYWWDFCPRMIHLGLWDHVSLEFSGPVRIDDTWVRPQLNDDLSAAQVGIYTTVDANEERAIELQADLRFNGEIVAQDRFQQVLVPGVTQMKAYLAVDDPSLWWPNGYGEQPLYEVELRIVTLNGRTEESDRKIIPFGFRRLAFVPNEQSPENALPYTLQVNGRRVYMKGWNWVPIDVMYGVERPEKLEQLLFLASRAHVNILRVWGGGLIEKDAFYNLCDRMGILVWQEFTQSSSGIQNCPSSEHDFVKWFVQEAREAVIRKRNHASLAVWCGGNELQNGEGNPLDEAHPLLSALRDMVAANDPDRHWLPTSPSGPAFGNSMAEIAEHPSDLHDVHGPWEYQGPVGQFELYNRGTCLLHSEFGVEGLTNAKALDQIIAPEHQWPVSLDNHMWEHLGAWWVKEKVWRDVFGEIADVRGFVQATQFMQYDGLRYAVEADRRRAYVNSGTLPWQFNEPYPMAACTSAIDYWVQPKPVYYAVANAYAPISVSARFPKQALSGDTLFAAEVWLSSSLDQELDNLLLEIQLVGRSGKRYVTQRQDVSAEADRSVQVANFHWDCAELKEDVFFIDLCLYSPVGEATSQVLAENRYLFTRTHNLAAVLDPSATFLDARAQEDGCEWRLTIKNTGTETAMFVWLQDARPVGEKGYVSFDRNYFCLFPNEERTVVALWKNISSVERRLSIEGWNTGLMILDVNSIGH